MAGEKRCGWHRRHIRRHGREAQAKALRAVLHKGRITDLRIKPVIGDGTVTMPLLAKA